MERLYIVQSVVSRLMPVDAHLLSHATMDIVMEKSVMISLGIRFVHVIRLDNHSIFVHYNNTAKRCPAVYCQTS